eukprot:9493708-Pyramimonas_sp.AAC.1
MGAPRARRAPALSGPGRARLSQGGGWEGHRSTHHLPEAIGRRGRSVERRGHSAGGVAHADDAVPCE